MGDDAPAGGGVEQAPAGREDPALEIGTRLAAIRSRQGLRVSELARKVGVSASLISQIERGQSRPSVSTLFALSEALDSPVDAFFRDTAPEAGPPAGAPRAPAAAAPAPGSPAAPAARGRYVVHRDERAVVDIDGGVRWERLTPSMLDAVDFMELVYAPGAESNPTLYRHPGMEMVLVLSGRLEIFVAFERYELEPGDSICFSSTVPHRYVNPGDEIARAVTVILLDAAATEAPGAVRP